MQCRTKDRAPWRSAARACAALAAIAALTTTGCGPIIRQAVNKRFPPVSPEQRQLGSIEQSEQYATALKTPKVYAFVTANQVSNYAAAVVAKCLPMTTNQVLNDAGGPAAKCLPLTDALRQYVSGPPGLSGFSMTFGRQEVAIHADFRAGLTGTHGNVDLSQVGIAGTVDINSYPEFVGSTDPMIASVVRLRPALINLQLCDLDLSKTKYHALYWLEKRKLVSAALDAVLAAFRDNVNGQLQFDVPLPIPSIQLDPDVGGSLSLDPSTLAYLQPEIADAAVEVSPAGIRVIADVHVDVLNEEPSPQTNPGPLPNSVPAQAPESDIAQHFQDLDRKVGDLLMQAFGSTTVASDTNVALISKDVLADAINGVINDRTVDLKYNGTVTLDNMVSPLNFPAAPNLYCGNLSQAGCDPGGSCVPWEVQQARNVLSTGCQVAQGALHAANDALDKACNTCVTLPKLGRVCTKDLSLGGCSALQATADAAQKALDQCNGFVNDANQLVNQGARISDSLANKIGLVKDACTVYDKVFKTADDAVCKAGLASWLVNCSIVQDGLNAASGQTIATAAWNAKGAGQASGKVDSLKIDNQLSTIVITGAEATGHANVDGSVTVTFQGAMTKLCPGPARPISFNSVGADVKLLDPTLSGAFGIADFAYNATMRPGFFVAPNPIDVFVSVQNSDISSVIRKNVGSLPCNYDPATWWAWAYADIGLLTGSTDVNTNFTPPRTRIGWAAYDVPLPVAEDVKMHVEGSIQPAALEITADPLMPALNVNTGADQVTRSTILGVSAGVGGAFAFRARPNTGSSVQPTAAPYAMLFGSSSRIGLFTSLLLGSDVGFGFGTAIRPFKGIDKLLFLAGGRLGAGGDGLRPMVGVAWEFGRLDLYGCQLKSRE
jgi:hypothetical protein